MMNICALAVFATFAVFLVSGQGGGFMVRYERPNCACPVTYNPVCGTNGQTYDNNCRLGCAERGVREDCKGQCPCRRPSTCGCSAQFQPVCGSNARSYSNACELRCAQRQNRNLVQSCDGRCPCPNWR